MTKKILRNCWTTGAGALALLLAVAASAQAQSPPTQSGQVLISEFRLAGPGTSGTGSQRDEFIELYNNTDQLLDISGLLIFAYDPNFNGPGDGADFVQALPDNVILPARSHFLIGDNGAYTLSAYAAIDFDTATLFAGDFFIDNEGLLLANADATVILDTIGFSGSGGRPGEEIQYGEGTPLARRTQTAPTVQYAYVRKMTAGLPQDTNNNANDFALVSVTGATFPLAAGGTTAATLGAPGPENTGSPVQSNTTIKPALLDPAASPFGTPNRLRSATAGGAGTPTAFGTLTFRRKFTNTSGIPVTQLRWRVVDITTLTGGTVPAGQADLRVISSPTADFNVTVTGGGSVPVKGTQVQTPPTQALGGGLNSSIVTITPATPIAPGGSVNIEFMLGVATTGSFRFLVNTEATFGALPALTSAQHGNKGALTQKARGARANSPGSASAPTVKRDALRVWTGGPLVHAP